MNTGSARGKISRESHLLMVRELTVILNNGDCAVDAVSFDLKRAECLALVGESGCGKTLSALSLLRAIPPEIGRTAARSLSFEGRELDDLSERELRKVRGGRISMIFQDPSTALNPLFSVGCQIVETILAHQAMRAGEARRRAAGLLEEAGLADATRFLDSYPHQLSGGQRQRVMIALALCTEPALLIADEPTTALDLTVQRQIIDLLGGLLASRDLALLLITHNLSVVAKLADRVLIMYAGQIVENAPVAELFARAAHPYTRALFGCLPHLKSGRNEPVFIPGTVPLPGNWPDGCRFKPRCLFARRGCDHEQYLRPFDGNSRREVRCWLADELFPPPGAEKR